MVFSIDLDTGSGPNLTSSWSKQRPKMEVRENGSPGAQVLTVLARAITLPLKLTFFAVLPHEKDKPFFRTSFSPFLFSSPLPSSPPLPFLKDKFKSALATRENAPKSTFKSDPPHARAEVNL